MNEPPFLSKNPYDGKILGTFQSESAGSLEKKLTNASRAYHNYWRNVPLEQRATAIIQLGEVLHSNLEELASLITFEMGKPIVQSRAEIAKCVWLCQYYGQQGTAFLQDKPVEAEEATFYITYEPLGGILGIMPWNFPFWQALRFAVPALLSGNVVFLKPAPNVPQCGLALESMMRKALGESALFQTVLCTLSQVEALIQDPFIQGVSLTGSDRAGSAVAAMAGKQLKRCVLELGGSDPFIVLSDANISEAARMAVESRMNNSGQTCIAAKRWIVEKTVAPDFTAALLQYISKMPVGNPSDENTAIGCLARMDLMQNLNRQVNTSKQLGARVLLDGGQPSLENPFFYPMVLTDLPLNCPARQEELFGPVGTLFEVSQESEAIRLANDTVYGLGASIWTADLEKGRALARQLNVGTVAINDMVRSDPRLPFGGIKRSGIGRELGEAGILEFVNIKSVAVQAH